MRILGFYGYTDAGKTTLATKLSNKSLSLYKAEAKKGITLKVGFIHYYITDPSTNEQKLIYVLDNPGHQSIYNENLRNIDIIDNAIYIVDSEIIKSPQKSALIKDHYFIYNSIFQNFKIPHVVLFNKIDLCTVSQLKELYTLFKNVNNMVKILPCCTIQKESLQHCRQKLNAHILKFEKKEKPSHYFKIVKSFDINRVNDFPQKGGVVGVYDGGVVRSPKDTFYISSRNSKKWENIHFKEQRNYAGDIIEATTPFEISTLETRSDPLYYKNDSKKGCFIMSKNQIPNHRFLQKFNLELKRSMKPFTKGQEYNFIYNGQTFVGCCKKIGKKVHQFFMKKGQPESLHFKEKEALIFQSEGGFSKFMGVGTIELID